MNAEEVGGNEVQEEHLPEGEPGFDLSADDILNQVWKSVEDAYEFYRRYGRVNRFGVRKGDSGKDSHSNVVRYQFFCNKEGLREIKHYNRIDRQRGHKPETRTGCKAMLSIYLEKSEQKWKVRKVVLDHNHDLAPVGMSYLIRSHRKMTDAAKAHIDGMHAYGIGTSKILGHMAGMSGGYSLLGFLKKDAYNYADKMRRSRIADGDANATLVYLEGKAVNEFKEDWAAAIEEFGLHDSSWARHMHEKRKLWVKAYLRDKFCARFQTTSRCEGINAVVNKFSKSSHTILELVQNLELVVHEYRNKEMLLQFNSIYTNPVMTTCLRSIEIAAASVYTRELFAYVRKEIEGAGAVNLLTKKRCLNTTVYYLEEYEKPDVQVMAAFGRSTGKLDCQCFFWEKNGYPCRHMFFMMKAAHLQEIPERLVLRRWRKDAKDIDQYGYERDTRGTKKVVRDPKVANPKGAPRLAKQRQLGKRRRCANCKHVSHTKRKCPQDRGKKSSAANDADQHGVAGAECQDDSSRMTPASFKREPGHGNAGNYARNLDDLRRQFADSTSGNYVGNNAKAGCTFNDDWANEVRMPACVYVSSLKACDDPSI
ncbi:hypothetical protein Ahy_A03g011074 [Arachis hypogaea]|uniref:SWIM-type domain-containing protein n=1 Tax=Arachis hypogaea TaxID=3818 RepID=A0A445DPI5_ARAHY|nr:hypothetical protein Ahy_A03g011074 [Arachis hypogaea]